MVSSELLGVAVRIRRASAPAENSAGHIVRSVAVLAPNLFHLCVSTPGAILGDPCVPPVPPASLPAPFPRDGLAVPRAGSVQAYSCHSRPPRTYWALSTGRGINTTAHFFSCCSLVCRERCSFIRQLLSPTSEYVKPKSHKMFRRLNLLRSRG